jgi:hypothetical protein
VARTSHADGSEADEVAQVERAELRAPVVAWYLGNIEVEPGETAVTGISLQLPDTSQTIIVNADIDSEDHEFALVYER